VELFRRGSPYKRTACPPMIIWGMEARSSNDEISARSFSNKGMKRCGKLDVVLDPFQGPIPGELSKISGELIHLLEQSHLLLEGKVFLALEGPYKIIKLCRIGNHPSINEMSPAMYQAQIHQSTICNSLRFRSGGRTFHLRRMQPSGYEPDELLRLRRTPSIHVLHQPFPPNSTL
jgi:hypothetical protein